MPNWNSLSRRDALRLSAMAMAAGTIAVPPAFAAGVINFADIGVGDPGGDWSKYKAASGYDVNLVAFGNAPSAILNVLVAGGGQGTYDIINIVGGMQKPLVENDLVEKIDTAQLPNWSKDTYLDEFLGKGKPGFKFIGYGDDIYGVPTVLQGKSDEWGHDVLALDDLDTPPARRRPQGPAIRQKPFRSPRRCGSLAPRARARSSG